MKTFRDSICNQEFTLTAQLKLVHETDRESVLRQAAILGPVVDAIQVTDNPSGTVHMSPLAASALLLQQGIDPVMQMTCRDRNRIALQSDLLGAEALGVTSLLIQRGDKLHDDHRPKTKQVFDIGGKALISAALNFNQDSGSADFFVGAVITAFSPKSGWRAKSLFAKTDRESSSCRLRCVSTRTYCVATWRNWWH